MWNGESSKLLAAKGYWKAVGAKLLYVFDETFCSIPTDGANCLYLDHLTSGASVTRCKPAKNGVWQRCVGRISDDYVSKMVEKRKKGVSIVGVAYLSFVGSLSVLYSNFFLIIGKIIL